MKQYIGTGMLREFAGARNEASWFAALRGEALRLFGQTEWPTVRDEEWRRTDISVFDLDDLSFSEAEAGPLSLEEPQILKTRSTAGLLGFDNGSVSVRGLAPEAQDAGVVFNSLSDWLADSADEGARQPGAESVERVLRSYLNTADNKVALWALAGASYGAVLRIPRGVVFDDPFVIEMRANGEDFVTFPFLAVVLEEGARASVQCVWEGAGGFLINQLNVFSVAQAANLEFSLLQNSSDENVVFSNGTAVIGRDARFRHFEAILGGGFVKHRIHTELAEPGSELELDGIYFADGNRHIDLRTIQNHHAPHAVSNAVYRGAVADTAQTVFQGLIEVDETAKRTDAYLSNKNLILNDGAQADSIPSLKINTDDVRCSHGSTTGKLRADQEFYLMSRGYSREEAREALITAYFHDVVNRVHSSIQEKVAAILHEQISRSTRRAETDAAEAVR